MIVYHGSLDVIEKPDVKYYYKLLDFGKGFYVTTVKKQAIRWAKRKRNILKKEKAVVNIYEMCEDLDGFKPKTFPDDLQEWLDFVCACRDGSEEYQRYDIISGKVADDDVFRVVDMYHSGAWEKERALREIKTYPSYDQIAFINQDALDKLLTFVSCEEI